MFQSSFGCEQFPCLLFVTVQLVVDPDCPPVFPCLIAKATQRATLAVLGAVDCILAAVSACGLRVGRADASHVLAHRADVIVPGCVVVETVLMERVRLVAGALLEVEAVVFDVGLYARLFHEAVVLF